jgi:hypothetical protein
MSKKYSNEKTEQAGTRRLERAAAFVAQLHRLSIKSPHSWRRTESVGRDVGLKGAGRAKAAD